MLIGSNKGGDTPATGAAAQHTDSGGHGSGDDGGYDHGGSWDGAQQPTAASFTHPLTGRRRPG
jgi:hypothetical protein